LSVRINKARNSLLSLACEDTFGARSGQTPKVCPLFFFVAPMCWQVMVAQR
jgi:hypothetical protein